MVSKRFQAFAFLIFTAISFAHQIQAIGQGYYLDDRWTSTATQNGGGLNQGDSTTLTWGIVADGTPITTDAGDPSSLISFMDANFGSAAGSDLTQRPWFSIFEESYKRWDEVSGLKMVYEPNDDGKNVATTWPGVLGVRADMRIGGHPIDGASGTLAYNWTPQVGNMVIDTQDAAFFTTSGNDNRAFRNVIMHEAGHGLGILHLVTDNPLRFLMEPYAVSNPSFDGPQMPDIIAAHEHYGDQYEEDGGNDVIGNATALTFTNNEILIGEDAIDLAVDRGDTDFVSIDSNTDVDYYSFELKGDTQVLITLTPVGGEAYEVREQVAPGDPIPPYHTYDPTMQSDLVLTLYGSDQTTVIAMANLNGLGGIESIFSVLSAGTYYVRVHGTQNLTQMYSLSIAAVPEPGTIVALSCLSIGVFFYRRRKNHNVNLEVAA